MSRQHPDVQFKTHEGFMWYTDMNDVAMDYMASVPLRELKTGKFGRKMSEDSFERAHSYLLSPAEVAMAGVQQQLIGHRLFYRPQESPIKRGWAMGMTREEFKKANKHTVYQGGIDDFQFTWQFAPAVASNVVREYVASGRLQPEQIDDFTLGDWANIIGSGWFAALCHDLAIAKEGTYNSYGKDAFDLQRNSLSSKLFYRAHGEEKVQIFDLKDYYEPLEGVIYSGASMNKTARKMLRAKRTEQSLGCPVARHHTTLDAEIIENDRHVQRLLNSGRVQVTDKPVKEGRKHLQLQYTAIDRTLALMADKFDEYEQQFGNHRVMKTMKGYRWVHLDKEASDYLRNKAEPNMFIIE